MRGVVEQSGKGEQDLAQIRSELEISHLSRNPATRDPVQGAYAEEIRRTHPTLPTSAILTKQCQERAHVIRETINGDPFFRDWLKVQLPSDIQVTVVGSHEPNAFVLRGVGKHLFITSKMFEVLQSVKKVDTVLVHEQAHQIAELLKERAQDERNLARRVRRQNVWQDPLRSVQKRELPLQEGIQRVTSRYEEDWVNTHGSFAILDQMGIDPREVTAVEGALASFVSSSRIQNEAAALLNDDNFEVAISEENYLLASHPPHRFTVALTAEMARRYCFTESLRERSEPSSLYPLTELSTLTSPWMETFQELCNGTTLLDFTLSYLNSTVDEFFIPQKGAVDIRFFPVEKMRTAKERLLWEVASRLVLSSTLGAIFSGGMASVSTFLGEQTLSQIAKKTKVRASQVLKPLVNLEIEFKAKGSGAAFQWEGILHNLVPNKVAEAKRLGDFGVITQGNEAQSRQELLQFSYEPIPLDQSALLQSLEEKIADYSVTQVERDGTQSLESEKMFHSLYQVDYYVKDARVVRAGLHSIDPLHTMPAQRGEGLPTAILTAVLREIQRLSRVKEFSSFADFNGFLDGFIQQQSEQSDLNRALFGSSKFRFLARLAYCIHSPRSKKQLVEALRDFEEVAEESGIEYLDSLQIDRATRNSTLSRSDYSCSSLGAKLLSSRVSTKVYDRQEVEEFLRRVDPRLFDGIIRWEAGTQTQLIEPILVTERGWESRDDQFVVARDALSGRVSLRKRATRGKEEPLDRFLARISRRGHRYSAEVWGRIASTGVRSGEDLIRLFKFVDTALPHQGAKTPWLTHTHFRAQCLVLEKGLELLEKDGASVTTHPLLKSFQPVEVFRRGAGASF